MNPLNLKIIFIGAPEFGAVTLEGLIKKGYKPSLVVTTPDKPVGRKQILTPPPVKVTAKKYKVQILQPEKISAVKNDLLKLKADLIIVASYGQILPKEILEIPKFGCLNVHPSVLPKYRGATPIQSAILNGDKETGVTIILMDEKLDHGKIISSAKYQIDKEINFPELTEKLTALGINLLIDTIPKWIEGRINSTPQDESKVTYTKILEKKDGLIDWQKPAEYLQRQIRAFNPWPGTFCKWQGKVIKILEADFIPCQNQRKIGEVFLTKDGKPAVQAGQNCLIVQKLQLEGKKPVNSEDFIKGHRDFIDAIL